MDTQYQIIVHFFVLKNNVLIFNTCIFNSNKKNAQTLYRLQNQIT